MDDAKVKYHKTQIDLMSFEIDLLDDASKIEVIKHLEETLSLLKIGSRDLLSPKKIKLETESKRTDKDSQTETEVFNETKDAIERDPIGKFSAPPIADEDAIRAMYEGLIPTCTDCGAKFPSLGALDNHSKMHEQKTSPLTPQNVKANAEIKPHNTSAHDSNEFNCTECGKYCFSKKNLLRHRVIHSNKYQCNTCGKNFYDSTSLTQHNRSEDNCLRYMNTLMTQTVATESTVEIREVETDSRHEDSIVSDTEDVTMEETINEESFVPSSDPAVEANVQEHRIDSKKEVKRQCPTCLHKFSS